MNEDNKDNGVATSVLALPEPLNLEALAGDVQPYEIVSANSGLVLDVPGLSTQPGTKIQQWTKNGGRNQLWTIRAKGAGTYEIVSVNSGLVLDVPALSTQPGAQIQQWTENGGRNQLWAIRAKGPGTYEIVSVNSGLVLDVPGLSTTPGTLIQQWTDNGGANQQWTLVPGQLPTELTFNFPNVTFDGGVPIGGNATVTVHQNGNYEFKGHFHKSSIVPFSYGIAIGVRDRAGHAYTFAHQYSFGGGVADDDFPYSGNNPAIAQHWPDLVAGASAKLSGSANIDIGGLVALVKSVISYIETAIGAVEGVIAIVGPLVAA